MDNQNFMNAYYSMGGMNGNINNMNTMTYQMPQITNMMWNGNEAMMSDNQIQPIYNSEMIAYNNSSKDLGLK